MLLLKKSFLEETRHRLRLKNSVKLYIIEVDYEIKENENLYKKQRNKCVSIRKKSIINYFNKIANGNI